jgi:hypothetical protein
VHFFQPLLLFVKGVVQVVLQIILPVAVGKTYTQVGKDAILPEKGLAEVVFLFLNVASDASRALTVWPSVCGIRAGTTIATYSHLRKAVTHRTGKKGRLQHAVGSRRARQVSLGAPRNAHAP